MLLAANWKMNVPPAEARRFLEGFLGRVPAAPGRRIAFFPPAVSLEAVAGAVQGRPDILVGVQDIHWEPKGAFTGATSAPLAAAAGAQLALIGHSERRHVFGERAEETRLKVVAALDGGLMPCLCVGETLEQREAGETEAVVLRQLRAALGGSDPGGLRHLVLAYEPVWAIGTGRTATPEDAAAVHKVLAAELAGLGAGRAPVLYGGSVKPENTRALLERPEIGGLLVGGASLDPEIWAAVIEEADRAARDA